MAHPAFDDDERCRDPRPEGATIVSIFRVPNARPAKALAQSDAAPEGEQIRVARVAGGRR